MTPFPPYFPGLKDGECARRLRVQLCSLHPFFLGIDDFTIAVENDKSPSIN